MTWTVDRVAAWLSPARRERRRIVAILRAEAGDENENDCVDAMRALSAAADRIERGVA